MTDNELFRRLPAEAIKRGLITPKLRIGLKSYMWFHRGINFVLNWFYPKEKKDWYLKNTTTTLGFKIDFPDTAAEATVGDSNVKVDGSVFIGQVILNATMWWTLLHELFHVRRAMKWTRIIYGWLYLWPLSQGVLLALLCWLPIFWSHGWYRVLWIVGWFIVAGLHFIPQLPDPFRKRDELEAYTASMWAFFIHYGKIDDDYLEWLIDNFHSMAYFIMEPNKDKIRRELIDIALQLEHGTHPIFNDPLVKLADELRVT
jgi:hypothetical protein